MAHEDEIDFTKLVDAYYRALYRFAFSLSGSSHDASDLVQETFTIFAQKGHTIRDASKVKTWLFTTLHRQFLRQIRKSKREQLHTPETLVSQSPSIESDAARALDGDSALQALLKISEVYRVPLTLYYLKHFNYREIGEILEVPIGTVMSRLARGKSELKNTLLKQQTPTRR
ncbi:RNA polymerase sigma factor [Puniceicoccus vermicola]|uniref:RNA polymerase sigma factor n=1 Tax=Puniceicoccus vermicola TaxID=388746 RepID=A0A7X1AUQ8_9BACT|nr:RNA polymerase sigma factor [Puniceicoccus vermicola]MBC2600361.1 RNA polymerase sigma factor [Puniceicoccus vermicola]